mmetsp:Transcript_52310/g.77450  ORF Transcript_52310/g.77450 Transcript_52310/m.77450 type:complete len:94 (-) Transcript_52310:9-290(-)
MPEKDATGIIHRNTVCLGGCSFQNRPQTPRILQLHQDALFPINFTRFRGQTASFHNNNLREDAFHNERFHVAATLDAGTNDANRIIILLENPN